MLVGPSTFCVAPVDMGPWGEVPLDALVNVDEYGGTVEPQDVVM